MGKKGNVVTGCMVQPVATTDYLCYTEKTGTGTNLTASLSGSVVFGSAQAKFTYTNSATQSGYITKMNARGIGIYGYSQVSAIEESADSYNEFGYQNKSLQQAYQKDLVVGTQLAKQIVNDEKQPKIKIVDVSFIANDSPRLMMAFLNIDIGSKVHIKDDRYEIDGYFYIQKIKFSIELGGIVRYTLVLKSILTLALGLTLIGCTFSGSPSTDAICYGNVESLVDLGDMSISGEFYPNTLSIADIASGWVDGAGGFEGYVTTTGRVGLLRVASTSGGQWVTPSSLLTAGQWNTFTITSPASGDPKIFVNGVEAVLTVDQPPVGAYASTNGMDFCIGNIHGQLPETTFTQPFNGTIRRVDIHNRLLTASEALAWSNGATISDGLVFQGNTVKTKDLTLYSGSLTSEHTFLDNVYGAVGVINGSPVCVIP